MSSWCSRKPVKKFNVYYFIDAIDLNWPNCYIEKAPQQVTKFLIKFMIIFIFFFVSSPVALYQLLLESELFSRFRIDVDLEFGYFFKTYFPTLMIILINNLIIYSIFILSIFTSNIRDKSTLLFIS